MNDQPLITHSMNKITRKTLFNCKGFEGIERRTKITCGSRPHFAVQRSACATMDDTEFVLGDSKGAGILIPNTFMFRKWFTSISLPSGEEFAGLSKLQSGKFLSVTPNGVSK